MTIRVCRASTLSPGRTSTSATSLKLSHSPGIRSRLEQIGGHVDLHSHPGEGTRVELFVPIKGAEPARSADRQKSS